MAMTAASGTDLDHRDDFQFFVAGLGFVHVHQVLVPPATTTQGRQATAL